jgi:glycosyltransferase involved in cell wall biosynthesis
MSQSEGFDEDVEFHGFVSDKESIYSGLDLVVVPSLAEEPFGLAALEPAARGIPVIASARGGLPEVVDDGQTGFLFPAGDSRRLAELMARIIDSPMEAAAMGVSGQQRARRLFSEEAMLMRMHDL